MSQNNADKKMENLPVLNSIFDVPNVDNFFFDMYGVLWSGKTLYPVVSQVMMQLREQGKKVYILTNQTVLHDKFVSVRQGQGLVKGVHYDDVITSGAVCFDAFKNGLLVQLTAKKDYKLYILGGENPELYANIQSHLTHSIEDADVVYISSIVDNRTETLEQEFIPVMRRAIERGLPAVCANPDVHVMVGAQKMIAQGAAAKWYAENGGRLTLFGKPSVATYQYALAVTGADVRKSVMVGDMLVTDILGANRSDMRSVLVLQTGMTSYELNHQNILLGEFINKTARAEKISTKELIPTYLLSQVGVLTRG